MNHLSLSLSLFISAVHLYTTKAMTLTKISFAPPSSRIRAPENLRTLMVTEQCTVQSALKNGKRCVLEIAKGKVFILKKTRQLLFMSLGPSINDVTNFLRFLTPPSPLSPILLIRLME